MVVVLPAPLGPTNPVTRPGCTAIERSSTATVWPYRFVSAVGFDCRVHAMTVGADRVAASRASGVFHPHPPVSRAGVVTRGVRAKIAEQREAGRRAADDNAVELARESQRVLAAARRLFAGRDGRLALTLVLA